MPKGIYECIDCGHREALDSSKPFIENACPKCGGDMLHVGFQEDKEGVPFGVQTERPILPEDLEAKLKTFYELELKGVEGSVFVFEVREIHEDNFERVLRELEEFGYWGALKKREGKVILFVFPAQEVKKNNKWLPWIFLIATIFTTLLAGYYLSTGYIATLNYYNLPGIRNPYIHAVAFSISVMTILGTHELGHKIAAACHGVKATMPYFIPFPSMLGTLGAVIRVKSPLPTRDAAIDLGVSGPITGFLVAIPVSIIGLRLSIPIPADQIQSMEGGIAFGENLIFTLLEKYVVTFPDNTVVFLHPVAIAGWVGILVTFLNLIPAAQLDGGHIARAFLSERTHRYLTMGTGIMLIAMSHFWVGWLIWGMLILLMGSIGNPGALDEVAPISKKRLVLAAIAVIIFLVSATPRPLWVTG